MGKAHGPTSAGALRCGFPPRILAMSMLLHMTARMLQQEGSISLPQYAGKSSLAGSRDSNNLARTLVYYVVERTVNQIPEALPRTWLDDISLRALGSQKQVRSVIVQGTIRLVEELAKEGLQVTDKSVLFASNMVLAKQVRDDLRKAGVKLKASTEGIYLGIERACGGCTKISTHTK